jgi:hypothetical protein
MDGLDVDEHFTTIVVADVERGLSNVSPPTSVNCSQR